jgi:hypothetical protein
MRPPSYSVPSHFSYQSTTMSWPSGLIEGMIRRTASSIHASFSGSSVVAKSWTSSATIWVLPTSVEWMEQVTRAITAPSSTRASVCSAVRPAGCASRRAISRRRGSRAWFAGELRTTIGIGLPRVEVPASSIDTRSEAAATVSR